MDQLGHDQCGDSLLGRAKTHARRQAGVEAIAVCDSVAATLALFLVGRDAQTGQDELVGVQALAV